MRKEAWTAGGLGALGIGLAINSLLGPFVADVIDYPLSETLINQTIGLDAFTLIVVAPACLLAAAMTLRGHPAAPIFAIGVASYAAYMLVQFIAGPAYLEVPDVLPLQLALLILSGSLGFAAWNAIDRDALRRSSTRADRRVAIAMFLLAAFVTLRYLPTLAGSLTAEPIPEESRDDPTMFWLIVMLDLGAVAPAAVAAGAGLLRGASWALAAAFAVAAWFALTAPAVATMAVVMLMRDDPFATTGTADLLAGAAIVFVGYAFRLFWPLWSIHARASASKFK